MVMMNYIFQIFETLLLISIAVSLFSYAFFWYENAGSAYLQSLKNSGKSLPLMIFRGILSSIASQFLIFVLYPFGFVRSLWEPETVSPTQPVVILVHGLYHNASAWVFVRHRLKKAGFNNIFALSYRSIFTSFETTLGTFEKFLYRVRKEAPDQPVILIGHSLGGLLARVYAERAETMQIPKCVITLGTPHQGSKVAAFGVGKLAWSLLFRGPLFEELEKRPLHLPCPGVALISPVDNLVLPEAGLKAPYPGWLYYETGPVSHVAMLFSRLVTRKVIEVIQQQSSLQ
jgi:pimeloyl-ACP methyl ester carboxylesterase